MLQDFKQVMTKEFNMIDIELIFYFLDIEVK